jgi:hypothetical protein
MPGQRLGAHHGTRHPPPANPGTPLHAGKAMTQSVAGHTICVGGPGGAGGDELLLPVGLYAGLVPASPR